MRATKTTVRATRTAVRVTRRALRETRTVGSSSMWTAPVVTMADPMPGYVSFSYRKLSNFPVLNR